MMTTPNFDRWNRAFKEGTSVVGERCCNSASTSAHASSADSTGNWNAGYNTTNSWFCFVIMCTCRGLSGSKSNAQDHQAKL